MPSRSEHFQSLVAANPNNELFRFSLAQALIADGRSAEAVAHLELCVAKKADWMIPRIMLGKLLAASGKHHEARRLFENALALAVDQRHEDPERELRALLAEL